MKRLLFLPLVLATLLINSCKYSNEYQVISVNKMFSVAIPPWMSKSDELKPGADFQYSNRYRNFYMIATSTFKTDAKRSFTEIQHDDIEVLRKAMINSVISDSTAVTAPGVTGTRMEVYGKMNDEAIYFSEVHFEGKDRFYHLSIWTRGEDRKLRYKEDINKIIASFKEL